MASNDVMESWEQIRLGVGDVEKLIGQKSYNLAMVKARQTLEIMVKNLMYRYDVDASDLNEAIENLYAKGVITPRTRDNYHEIRKIGNAALHEGDASVSKATEAFHLLSQEVYTFANSVKRNAPSGGNRKSQRKRKAKRRGNNLTPVIAILGAVIIVIVVIMIIKSVSKKKPVETEPETTEMTIEYVTIEETESFTLPPTEASTTQTPQVWVTNDYVNVRKQPNTECERWAVLDPGTVVDYVGDAEVEGWAKVNYQGNEGYVSKDFIQLQQ